MEDIIKIDNRGVGEEEREEEEAEKKRKEEKEREGDILLSLHFLVLSTKIKLSEFPEIDNIDRDDRIYWPYDWLVERKKQARKKVI